MKVSRLRAARKAQGLTLEQVSERTGVPLQTIHVIERGEHTPALDRAARLYYNLGLDIEDALADFGVVIVPREEAKQEETAEV